MREVGIICEDKTLFCEAEKTLAGYGVAATNATNGGHNWAILVICPPSDLNILKLCEENGLYAMALKLDGKCRYLLADLVRKPCGFRSNQKFGREAYDEIAISELEIERIAREAYELSHGSLALLDLPSLKATSTLLRKIVSDINEDYPNISLDMSPVYAPSVAADIILTQNFLIAPALQAIADKFDSRFDDVAAYFGNTAFGIYVAHTQASMQDAIKLMLSHSFDMDIQA